MNTGIIIQARCSSTRLKDKVVMPIPADSNISMLGRFIIRSKKACDNVILATSELSEDDLTAEEALKYGAKVYRGSLDDVLLRYIGAAEKYNVERIVRITADCPCIDYNIIKKCIDEHINSKADYVSNVEKRTFPHGLDTEVVTLDALKKTDREEKDIRVREHVTWHVRKSDNFSKIDVVEDGGNNYSDIRITVDTNEDYALINLVYFMLGDDFTYKDIIQLFNNNSWLKELNKSVYQKYVFKSEKEEIDEALKLLKLNGMSNAYRILERAK